MAAFYKTKGWYKSKTIWAGILTTLLAVASLFGYTADYDANMIVDTIFAALGALAIFGRVSATEAIGSEPATT